MGRNKPNNIKGQGAVEFVLITAVLMIIFSTGIIVAESNLLKIQEQRTEQLIDEYIDGIETEIQLGIEAGTGYKRKFYIPETIQGLNYTIIFEQGPAGGRDELIIKTDQGNYVRFLNQPTSGDLSKGWNEVQGGDTEVTLTPNVDPPVRPEPPIDPGAGYTIPGKPTNLRDLDIGSNFIKIAWDAPTDDGGGITSYNIYDRGTLIKTSTGTTTTITGLTPNTEYKLTVKATNPAGTSEPSAALTITTLDNADTEPPTTPYIEFSSTETTPTHNTISITWSASTDNVAVRDYTVYIGTIEQGTTTSTEFTITGLTPETYYEQIHVIAYDTSGNPSYPSTKLAETTLPDPLTDDWFLPTHGKRIKINFKNELLTEPVVGFPAHIVISEETIPGFSYSDVYLTQEDIVFVDENNVFLNFEKDEWNSGGKSHFYVRTDIGLTGDEYIYMYYGQSPATPIFNNDPSAVWAGYVGVWHFTEDPTGDGFSFKDSAGRYNDEADTYGNIKGEAVQESAYTGPSLALDGIDDYLVSFFEPGPGVPETDIQQSAITLTAWIKTGPSGITDGEDKAILNKPNQNFCQKACPKPPELHCEDGTEPGNDGLCDNVVYPFMIGVEDNDGLSDYTPDDPTKDYTNCRVWTDSGQLPDDMRHNVPKVPRGVWTYLACTYDGEYLRSFVDGGEVYSTALTGNIVGGKEYLIFGARKNAGTTNTNRLFGNESRRDEVFDEVRIYNGGKKDSWIKAQYLSQKGALQLYDSAESYS